MSVAIIDAKASLALHWEHIIYTLARLLPHDLGKPFAADFVALEKRHAVIEAGLRNVWRDEIIAQAKVDIVDDELDDATRNLSRELTHLDGDKSPRIKRYFPKPVSRFTGLGLQTQAQAVAAWPKSLKAEAEPVLKKLAGEFASVLGDATTALDGRVAANAARADYRVRDVLSFIEDHNKLRLATHAGLSIAGAKAGLPRSFADRFFRRDSRSTSAEEPEGVEEPATPT